MKVVADTEADGFLDVATKMWCFVGKNIDTEEVSVFYEQDIKELVSYLSNIKYLIGHNFFGYDLPFLKKLYNIDYTPYSLVGKGCKIVDTLALSRYSFPDRPLPLGYKGKGGSHSLECWGYRVGRWKPEITDWENLSLEEYVHRCTEDVEINRLMYLELIKELKK